MADKIKVLLHGPILTVSGYGEHARFILSSLRTREDKFDLFLHTTPWGACRWLTDLDEEREYIDSLIRKTAEYERLCQQNSTPPQYDVSLQVILPTEWKPLAKVNLGVTSGIETNKVVPAWNSVAENMNAIVVESEHAKSGFNTSTPIHVVSFPFVDCEPEKFDFDLDTEFNFLMVAMDIPRKNIEQTIDGFYKEFSNNSEVGLVCKLGTATESPLEVEKTKFKVLNVKRRYPEAKCSVYFLSGELNKNQMSYLYTHPKIKAIVTTTHGEGFGIPLFESACKGLPVIAPNWSAHPEFLRIVDKNGKIEDKFSKIDFYMDKVDKSCVNEWYSEDQVWAYPITISLCKKMRNVKEFYGKFASMAKELREHLKETLPKPRIDAEITSLVIKYYEEDKK